MKRYIIIFWALLLLIHLNAQQAEKDSLLNRTIVVENEYSPAIMDAAKINILPHVEEPALTKKDIEYSEVLFPLTVFGIHTPMHSLKSLPLEKNISKGYVRVGYGNYGNIDVKGNYLFDFTNRDRLNLYASLDGLNGKLSLPSSFLLETDKKWKARYYRTQAGADYLHGFNTVDLNMAGHFESDVFSYLPTAGKQHYTKGSLHAKVLSKSASFPVRFAVETNYLYFDKKYHIGDQDNDREQIVRTRADLSGSVSEKDKIGLRIAMDNLFYSQTHRKNYTVSELNPYYQTGNESWKLKLGIHADLSFGKGKTFQAAPDLDIQYIFSDNYVLYLTATGGRVLNDYRRLQKLAPLGAPDKNIYAASLKNTYIPFDGSIGLKARPLNGFWFNLFGGYRFIQNDLCLTDSPSGGLFDEFASYVSADTKVAYAALYLKYDYLDRIHVSVKGNYYHWQADKDYLLVSKPEMKIKTEMSIKALKGLYLSIGYQYIRRTGISGQGDWDHFGSYYELSKSGVFRMKDINNLFLSGTYDLFKGVSIFIKLDNLLNKNYQYDYTYPAERFNFLAGGSFSF